MKRFLITSLLVIFITLIFAELLFQFREDKLDLLALTGKKEAVNPMLSTWAKNEPFFAYSARKSFPLEGKTINLHSFISTPEIEFAKDSGTTRVAFLGGSSTAGTGKLLIDEETWPWKVAEQLKSKGLKVDFINAAASGYTTFESYGILWSKLRFFKPDILVINHGWNDYSYFDSDKNDLINIRKNEEGIYEGVNFMMYYETYVPKEIDEYIFFSQLLSRMRLMIWNKKGKGEVYPFKEIEQVSTANQDDAGKLAFKDNLKLIETFCVSNGISCFFCLQPTLATSKGLKPEIEAETKRVEYVKEHLKEYLEIYEILEEVVPESNIIDLTSVSLKEENFIDYIHPSIRGTDHISEIVTDSLWLNYFKSR